MIAQLHYNPNFEHHNIFETATMFFGHIYMWMFKKKDNKNEPPPASSRALAGGIEKMIAVAINICNRLATDCKSGHLGFAGGHCFFGKRIGVCI
jgi:hypothetical protein